MLPNSIELARCSMRRILMKGMGRFQLQNVWCPSCAMGFVTLSQRDVQVLGSHGFRRILVHERYDIQCTDVVFLML